MQYRFVLNKVSGLFIIAMGLTLTGIVRVGWLTRERRVPLATRQSGALRSISLGAAFAFAWTPCIRPILASVLLYAGSVATVKVGALLLLVYALGLGVPFVLTGLAFSRAIHALRCAGCADMPDQLKPSAGSRSSRSEPCSTRTKCSMSASGLNGSSAVSASTCGDSSRMRSYFLWRSSLRCCIREVMMREGHFGLV